MQLQDFFDNAGNFNVGPRFSRLLSRISVAFQANDQNGIALEAGETGGVARRSVIKLGDYTLGQDTAADGTKNFALLNASGVKVAELANGSGVNASASRVPYNINIPLIIAPTGSMGDNSALTSGTANPLTYLKTYTWFPASALYSTGTTPASAANSAAGWYYTVWTTTTAATVYADTWDGISAPTIPATPTALPVALTGGIHKGPGAFTGPTTEALYFALPMVAANVNTFTQIDMKCAHTNNANVKSAAVRMTNLAGTVLASVVQTSLLETDAKIEICQQGYASKQRISGLVAGSTANARITNALAAEAQNVAYSLAFTVTKATATDVTVVEGLLVTTIG